MGHLKFFRTTALRVERTPVVAHPYLLRGENVVQRCESTVTLRRLQPLHRFSPSGIYQRGEARFKSGLKSGKRSNCTM